jgi:hypothetical protein
VLTTGVGLSRRKIIDGEFTVVSTRRQRPSIGFLSCLHQEAPLFKRGEMHSMAQEPNSSRSAFASFRSRVSNPSVNHPYTGANSSRVVGSAWGALVPPVPAWQNSLRAFGRGAETQLFLLFVFLCRPQRSSILNRLVN